MSDKVSKIVDNIKELSVVEAFELKKALEEEFGVEASAPMQQMATAPAANGGEEEEEQTEFDVFLTDLGSEKISVIKVVKEVSGLGLKEAKELAESAPDAKVAEAVSKDKAEEIKGKVEEAGGKVELK